MTRVVSWEEDFRSSEVGSGLPTGLTNRWDENVTFSIESASVTGPKYGKQLYPLLGAASSYAVSLDAAGQLEDVDVLAMCMGTAITGSQSRAGVAGRVQGTSGYTVALRTTSGVADILIFRRIQELAVTRAVSFDFPWQENTWYFLRMRIVGDSIRARAWLRGDSEPSSWLVDVTDDEISGSGYAGLHMANATTSGRFGYVQVSAATKEVWTPMSSGSESWSPA